MISRLWLIGGTQESRWLMDQIQAQYAAAATTGTVLISVTTEAARALYASPWEKHVWVGKLTPDRADSFIREHAIAAILDMSHPFATQISERAIALAHHHDLPYLRYERAAVDQPKAVWRDRRNRPGYLVLSDLQQLFAEPLLSGERTLLTLGYRRLAEFAPWQSQGTLFARILPSQTALAAALKAGFTPDRLIALRPPITPALETALWQQWDITQVVTKASGYAGGEAQKQAIAAALGVRLICLARPSIPYPQQTDRLDAALSFALRYCT